MIRCHHKKGWTARPEWLTCAPFAHRGLHGPDTGPENSLAAINAAVAAGYGVECDVRLLADGEVVVFHDQTLARMTGRPGRLADLRTTDLASLRLGDTDERPPLLGEVLDSVKGRVPLYIELKTEGAPGPLERRVLEHIRSYAGPFCLASFNPRSLAFVARHDPSRVRCLIASHFHKSSGMEALKRFFYRHLFHAALARPHCIAYDWRGMPNWSVAFARSLGAPVLLWTVRTREDMEKALRHGDNIVFEDFSPSSPETHGSGRACGRPRPGQPKEL
jgi:glycerophosphoryl diester phosphodiesterase